MSGTNTTSSGTPISDLPLASAVAPTDTLLAVVGGGSASAASAQQVSVGVLGSAISIAAGIPDAVTSATQAATQADAAAKKAYDASVQAVQDQAGAAGGVAALDDQARLLLQGRSALMVTPATSGGDGVPGMPTTLSPMLPLNPNTAVGISDVTLGGAIALASGAIQSSCLGSSVAGLSPITVSSGGTAQPVLNGNNVAVTTKSMDGEGSVTSTVVIHEIGDAVSTLYAGVSANNATIVGLIHEGSHLSSDGTEYSGDVSSATVGGVLLSGIVSGIPDEVSSAINEQKGSAGGIAELADDGSLMINGSSIINFLNNLLILGVELPNSDPNVYNAVWLNGGYFCLSSAEKG